MQIDNALDAGFRRHDELPVTPALRQIAAVPAAIARTTPASPAAVRWFIFVPLGSCNAGGASPRPARPCAE